MWNEVELRARSWYSAETAPKSDYPIDGGRKTYAFHTMYEINENDDFFFRGFRKEIADSTFKNKTPKTR